MAVGQLNVDFEASEGAPLRTEDGGEVRERRVDAVADHEEQQVGAVADNATCSEPPG